MGKPNTNYCLKFLSQQIRKFLHNCHAKNALTLIVTQTHMIFCLQSKMQIYLKKSLTIKAFFAVYNTMKNFGFIINQTQSIF